MKKRLMAITFAALMATSMMGSTVFAATAGYNYTYNFNLGTGGSTTYNGKTEKDFWYPSDEAATWRVDVNSGSQTYVKSATLYYIRSFNTDMPVESMPSIGAGGYDSKSFVGIDGKTYYAIINANSNAGVYGTTNLSQ